jgi:transposase
MGWKKFCVVPLYSAQPKQQSKRKFKNKKIKFNNIALKDIDWNQLASKFLNLKKSKKFFGSFSTDGVGASVKYIKIVKSEEPPKQKNFDTIIGVDPGEKIFIAGARVNTENISDFKNIKISNKKYQHMNGHFRRKKQLLKLGKES